MMHVCVCVCFIEREGIAGVDSWFIVIDTMLGAVTLTQTHTHTVAECWTLSSCWAKQVCVLGEHQSVNTLLCISSACEVCVGVFVWLC